MSTVDDVGKVCTLEVPYGPFPVNWKPPHFMEGVTGCGRHSSICGPSLSVCLSDCRCPSSPLFHLSGLPLAGHPHVWLACDRRISSLGHWRWRRSEDKFHFFFLFFLKMYLFICFAIHSVDKLPVLILLCKLVLLLTLKYIHECILPLECN